MINRRIEQGIKQRQGTGNFNAVPWLALLSLAAAAVAAAAPIYGAGFSGAALAQDQNDGEPLPAPGNLYQLHQPDAATPCAAAGLRWDLSPGGEAQWQDSARMDRPPGGGQSGYVVPAVQYPEATTVVHYLSGTAADGVCDFRVRLTAGGKSGPWSELAVRPAVNRPPAFPARAVERRVAENLPAGANADGPAAAADPDGDVLSYAIAGDDAASFSVDTAGASLDYEKKSSYRFFLSAADGKRGADAVPVIMKGDVLYARGSEPARHSFETDLYRPTAVLTGPSGPVSGSFEVVLTFSHPVRFFHAGDLEVTNGAAEEVYLDGNGTVQRSVTVTIVLAGDGPVVVSLPARAVQLIEYATSADPILNAEALTVVSGQWSVVGGQWPVASG